MSIRVPAPPVLARALFVAPQRLVAAGAALGATAAAAGLAFAVAAALAAAAAAVAAAAPRPALARGGTLARGGALAPAALGARTLPGCALPRVVGEGAAAALLDLPAPALAPAALRLAPAALWLAPAALWLAPVGALAAARVLPLAEVLLPLLRRHRTACDKKDTQHRRPGATEGAPPGS